MAHRSDKSTGADKISARLLKAAAPALTVSVTSLINNSIVSGTFPTLWKLPKITPIHKKGPIENMGNYRPITVLILERHVHDSLYTYLMSHNVLHDGQSGFPAENSCETAVNHMVHKWTSAIDKGLVNGVPQGSILGPLFFIVIMNDMPMSKRTISNVDMYADDSTISACGKNVPEIELKLHSKSV